MREMKLTNRVEEARCLYRGVSGVVSVWSAGRYMYRACIAMYFGVRSLNTCLNTSRYITIHVSESKLSLIIREQTVPLPLCGHMTHEGHSTTALRGHMTHVGHTTALHGHITPVGHVTTSRGHMTRLGHA